MTATMRPRYFGLGADQQQQSAGWGSLETAAISAGVSIATQLLIGPITHLIRGCGEACSVTSNWANQAEDLLKQNLQQYQSLPVHSRSVQAAFVKNFDTIWNFLVSQCNNPQLGEAGRNCVSDRTRGACKWRDTAGACWSWYSGYRDPIANDPTVVDDSIGGQASSFFSSLGGSDSNALPLLLGAGLILAAVTVL